jgi:DNA modification methylase
MWGMACRRGSREAMTKKTVRRSSRAPRRNNKLPRHLFDVHHGDARKLASVLPDTVVNVTLTSPPYFNSKDYGVSNQIGYGQSYEAYLEDLRSVFEQVFRATKQDGSLWIVIDTFHREREVLPLPFDLVARLKCVGWVLRDVIIWKKERTVPWMGKATRRIFEYILVLSKSKEPFKYFIDTQRNITDLRKWWVRYPERYNPRGKALDEIWTFDIPTQGSWGQHYVRHFCPLPSALVSRVISLTTEAGDIVLDPFSGSGTVPAVAHRLGRKYIGFELNKTYIKKFRRYLGNGHSSSSPNDAVNGSMSVASFRRLITNLRILKFARLLLRATVRKFGPHSVSHVFTRPLRVAPALKHQICSAEYVVVLGERPPTGNLLRFLSDLCSVPPLSKFGISPTFHIVKSGRHVPAAYKAKALYLYSAGNAHRFAGRAHLNAALKTSYPVVSVIRAHVEIPDG